MVQDDAQGHYNWISELLVNAKKLSICGDLNNKDVKSSTFRYYADLTTKDIKQAVIEKKKLRTYSLFKTVFKQEKYITVKKNPHIRCCYAKFRTSAHDLEIERGRHLFKPIPLDKRTCAYCVKNGIEEIENELHFSMKCPLYQVERLALLTRIGNKFPNITKLDNSNIFIWCMTQEEDQLLTIIAKFIAVAFDLRYKFLKFK